MKFNLETTEMDLGDTPIENIFLNDYMPMANGTYVKVYLLGYKYANDRDANIQVDNKTISKHLQIPLEDVLGAWDFWEEKGIIIKEDKEDKINYKVKFLNLKQLLIKNNSNVYKEDEEAKREEEYKKVQFDHKNFIEANRNPVINQMFNTVDYILRRQTQPMEKKKIVNWIKDYNMNPDVIEKAFFYAVERKGIKKIHYVEGIILQWYDQGLTNIEAVNESFKTQDERFYRYNKVMTSLGLGHKGINDGDLRLIDKWFDEYSYSMDLVLEGCSRSSNTSNVTVKYIDGVISSWYDKGITSVDEIELKDKKEKKVYKAPAKKNTNPVKTRFHNFEQKTDKYSEEDLEEIAKRKRKSFRQGLKGGS